MSDLSSYLATFKGERSIDHLAENATKAGYPLSRSVVAKYLRGEHGPNVPEPTLQGLAAGFGVDVRHLRELAGRPRGELGPYDPDPRSASLTQAQRDALDQLIVTIVTEGGQSGWVGTGGSEDTNDDRGGGNVHQLPTAAQTGGRGKSTGQIQQEQADQAGEEPDPPAPED